jgi:anti-sigma regulatory factor (Ser/Thr protein kinase)
LEKVPPFLLSVGKMQFNAHKSFMVSDRSYMSSARRDISKFAGYLGFQQEHQGKIDIIVSEMASNLIKHNAVGGEILVRKIQNGIELLSLDNGPGMNDLRRMMEDGVSTYGSKGEGLGAIKRLSDEFDIYSLPGIGTFILSRVYIKKDFTTVSNLRPRKKIEVSVIMVPKAGEILCGDGCGIVEDSDQLIIMAADGLGHGTDAHAATEDALNVFQSCMKCVPAEILKIIHTSIRKTRGIVGGIANINLLNGTISYCGIGNIAGRIISKDGTKSLVSYNGTIGYNIPGSFKNHSLPWDAANTLILHSDGLKSRWDLTKYPGIERHDASLMAAVIYKDNTRKTDDALVVVVRI